MARKQSNNRSQTRDVLTAADRGESTMSHPLRTHQQKFFRLVHNPRLNGRSQSRNPRKYHSFSDLTVS